MINLAPPVRYTGSYATLADATLADATLADADCVALARGFLHDPRWTWHAAAALGTDAVYPPQYLRARPEHWPGAALTPHRPTRVSGWERPDRNESGPVGSTRVSDRERSEPALRCGAPLGAAR